MRCLFCKTNSTESKSVEHVVPESLWNSRHVLPKGVVCDACNNYFARKVEKPFLDSPAISRLRFDQVIPNKRGRVPPSKATLLPGFPVVAYRETSGPYIMSLDAPIEALKYLAGNPTGSLILPASAEPPSDRIVSRFLAKMAVEAMALRLLKASDGLSYLVDEPQLDPIRNFARRGQPNEWPHHSRRIYDVERSLSDFDGNSYQTVHEFMFLVTENQEWFFVFVLFGLELTINLGGPEIDGYVNWLNKHKHVSPLESAPSR